MAPDAFPAFALSARARTLSLILSTAFAAAACSTPMGQAPVINRDTNVGLAPIIQSGTARNAPVSPRPSDPRTAEIGSTLSGGGPRDLSRPPEVASRPPAVGVLTPGADGSVTGAAGSETAASGVVVESAAIESGRVDARPLAGDAAAGEVAPLAQDRAPVVTMTPEAARTPAAEGPDLPPMAAVSRAGSGGPVQSPSPPPANAGSEATNAGAASAETVPSSVPAPAASQAPSAVAAAPESAAAGSGRFIWPASGAVTKSFTDPKSLGIAIAGKVGDPVSAVADGRVIFSGLGPRGYGRLLIVKHDDELLSVYANNRALLVKEGDTVRQGERVAELGSSGTEAPRLHFEIRRLGKPVDPISYLPPKLQ